MKVDIIIPAFNVHKFLPRCLGSILMQSIIADCKITVVDDASTDGIYDDIITSFSPYMDIQLLRYEVNGGPGVARQYGYDHTTNPLVTFIDADDTLAGAYALAGLRADILSNPAKIASVGTFLEESIDNQFHPHPQDLVWMFGKMYKRAFLDKHKIRFHETSRANEDNGFNTQVRLMSSEQEQISFIEAVVYYWHMSPNSITRMNDCEYSYNQSFPGYAENQIFAIKRAKKQSPFNGMINLWSAQCMVHLYEYYLETIARKPEFGLQNFYACQNFFDEIYRDLEPQIPPETISEIYSQCMMGHAQKMFGIIPHITFKNFLNLLREHKEDENY